MLGLTPIAGAPTADFHNDLLFIEKVGSGGLLVGGTSEVIRIATPFADVYTTSVHYLEDENGEYVSDPETGEWILVEEVEISERITGFIVGGSSPQTTGEISGGGYPIYGDIGYGDMPYLERQQEMEGGIIVGGTATVQTLRNEASSGGFIVGGAADYVRIRVEEFSGGLIIGGWGDEQGDFSKLILVTFMMKWPEAMFVPPSEREDIPNILRSLE